MLRFGKEIRVSVSILLNMCFIDNEKDVLLYSAF